MAKNTSGYDFWNSALGKALKAVKKGVLSLWLSVKKWVKKLFTSPSLINKNSNVVSTAPLATKSPEKPVSNPNVESNRSALETIEFPDYSFIPQKKEREKIDLHFKQTPTKDDFAAKKSLKPVEKAKTPPLSRPVSKDQNPEILASSHAHQKAQAPASLNTVQNAPLLNQPLAGAPLNLKPSVVTPPSSEVAKKPDNEKEALKLEFEKTLNAVNKLVQHCSPLPSTCNPNKKQWLETISQARDFICEAQSFVLSDKVVLSPESYNSLKKPLNQLSKLFTTEFDEELKKDAPEQVKKKEKNYTGARLAICYDQRCFESVVYKIKFFSVTQALNSLPPEKAPSSLKASALVLETELKKNGNFLTEEFIGKINQFIQDVDALSTKKSPVIKS